MRKLVLGGALASCLALAASALIQPAGAQQQNAALVIQGGTLIDGNGGAPVTNAVIVTKANVSDLSPASSTIASGGSVTFTVLSTPGCTTHCPARRSDPNHATTMAEVLRGEGYTTFMVGKWHLCPMEQASAAGPYDQWPLARGFDRFYGFMDGETDQFSPDLTYDNHRVDPPATAAEKYILPGRACA